MGTIDVLAVDISIQLLVILLESSKSLLTMGNIQATVQSSLQQQNTANVKKLGHYKRGGIMKLMKKK